MSHQQESNFLTTGCTCGPCITGQHGDCKGSNCNCPNRWHNQIQFVPPDTMLTFGNKIYME